MAFSSSSPGARVVDETSAAVVAVHAGQARGRSRAAVGVAAFAALVWLALVWAAPAWTDAGSAVLRTSAAIVYRAGAVLCHQRKDRSFQRADLSLPVCGRCTGLYAGAALGLALAAMARPRRWPTARLRRVFGLALLPTALLVAAEWTHVTDPGNWGRALAAVPAGLMAAVMVGMALGEGALEGLTRRA